MLAVKLSLETCYITCYPLSITGNGKTSDYYIYIY